MMREIKFRAWLGSEKRMVTPFIEINSDNLPTTYANSASRYPLMQYTGLKDCNGVEIYEGDVIKAKHAHKGNIKGAVELSEYEDNEQYIDETHLGWNVNGIPLVDLINEGAVIIGNIHENPELLEDKQ